MRRAHAMPFGAELTEEGVRFSLWSPTAREVRLVVEGESYPMPEHGAGWRRLTLPRVRPGARYRYEIDGDLLVPDPASRFQPEDVTGPSVVVDPAAYEWQDAGWSGRPWEEAVLYEVHVGTATTEGTYAALARKLETLRELGVTAIELMPLADFPGRRNWGYDGVLPFAPDSSYGTPDELKRLIDTAHGLGLMVFLDVVYNHFGPSGNLLHAYAKSFFTDRHKTPWGDGMNFDGAEGGPVREFFVHNALYWLEEFHFDGLRFDAVHAILDDGERHILAEIAERVRSALPERQVHLVLENEANEARWLARQDGQPRLYTAQWNDDVHHCWHALLTGEDDGYYEDYADLPVARLGRCLAEGFAYQGEASQHRGGEPRGEPSAHLPPSAFVAFLQNHDQIGNRALGERLSHLAPPDRLALARAGLLLSPQIPLFFMGEEWAASSPFLYFVDFSDEPALSDAVREGRRAEFARFRAFAGEDPQIEIPDPTAEDTFRRSILDWTEATRPPGATIREEVQRLLRLRQEQIVPLTRTAFEGASWSEPAPGALEVEWRFAGGLLRFAANFGKDEVRSPVAGTAVLWASAAAEIGTDLVRLRPWSGVFLTALHP